MTSILYQVLQGGPLIGELAIALLFVCLGIRLLMLTFPWGSSLGRGVPWSMRSLPHLQWRPRAFLGFGRGLLMPVQVWAGWRDTVGIVGVPGMGKTATLVSQLRSWDGAAVSTSTKPDVIPPTMRRRLELAQTHGGKIYLFAPTWQGGQMEGLEPMNWSPLAGCEDLVVCQARVTSLVESARPGQDMKNAGHWVESASSILRGLFAAAACHQERAGDMRLVMEWLDNQAPQEAIQLLSTLPNELGKDWARRLARLDPNDPRTNQSEINSFWSTARSAVAALSNPVVLARTKGVEFDPKEFVRTYSTLYVVAPPQDQKTIAPLVSALVESISQAQLALRGSGEQTPPLMLNLDEVANIAPLASLPTLVSQGASQGVNTTWVVQNMGQLRARYGVHEAAAITDATTIKLITGGLTEMDDLDRFSRLCGEIRVKERERGQPTTVRIERRLPADELRLLKPFRALMLARNHRPVMIKLPSYWRALSLKWAPSDHINRMNQRGRRMGQLAGQWAARRVGSIGERLPMPHGRQLPAPGAAAQKHEEIAE